METFNNKRVSIQPFLEVTSDTKAVEDMNGNRLLLITSDWAVRWAETPNETLKLSEFGNI